MYKFYNVELRYYHSIYNVYMTFQAGDVIISAGPDIWTTCAAKIGRILQLNTEYLAGVGGPCSYYNEWEPLSAYSEWDLEYLRAVAENVQENKRFQRFDLLTTVPCNSDTLHVPYLVYMTSVIAVAASIFTTQRCM